MRPVRIDCMGTLQRENNKSPVSATPSTAWKEDRQRMGGTRLSPNAPENQPEKWRGERSDGHGPAWRNHRCDGWARAVRVRCAHPSATDHKKTGSTPTAAARVSLRPVRPSTTRRRPPGRRRPYRSCDAQAAASCRAVAFSARQARFRCPGVLFPAALFCRARRFLDRSWCPERVSDSGSQKKQCCHSAKCSGVTLPRHHARCLRRPECANRHKTSKSPMRGGQL